MDGRVKPGHDDKHLAVMSAKELAPLRSAGSHYKGSIVAYLVSGQPLSAALGNALSPGTVASSL